MHDAIELTKIEVAERQLDTAIWLWFHEADIVSVISLTGAAAGVLDDVMHDRKIGRLVPFIEENAPKEMTARKVRDLIRSAQKFAKHARNDPDEAYLYEYEFAEHYLYCALIGYETLNPRQAGTGLRWLFAFRHWLFWPHDFDPSSLQIPQESFDVGSLKQISHTEFLAKFGNRFLGKPPWTP